MIEQLCLAFVVGLMSFAGSLAGLMFYHRNYLLPVLSLRSYQTGAVTVTPPAQKLPKEIQQEVVRGGRRKPIEGAELERLSAEIQGLF